MIALLLLACEPETVREGSPEDVDLSGYATLEDLAALQEQLDELRDSIDVAVPASVTGPCDSDVGSATIDMEAPIEVLSVTTCYLDNVGLATEMTLCGESLSWTTREPTYSEANGYVFRLTIDCLDRDEQTYTVLYREIQAAQG